MDRKPLAQTENDNRCIVVVLVEIQRLHGGDNIGGNMACVVVLLDASEQEVFHLEAVPAGIGCNTAASFRDAVTEKNQHVSAFHGQNALVQRLVQNGAGLIRIGQRDTVAEKNGRRVVILNKPDLTTLGGDKCKGGISQAMLLCDGKNCVHRADAGLKREAALSQTGDQDRSERPFDIVWVQLVVCALLIGYLLWQGLGTRLRNYFWIAIFALGSIIFFNVADYGLNHVLQPHQRTRINVLLGLEEDLKGAGYNVHQSEIAIGSGGLEGKGFLNGTQTKLKYVPEQDTDFIFCTVGEEEGFVGSAGVLLLFLALILRLIHLAERQPYRFGRVYGYCVLSIFLFHVFINVGMVLGLTPVIGIPLPFFSYGGSSLWGFTFLLFIFLRIDASRNMVRS